MKVVKKTEIELLEEEVQKGNTAALYNLGYIYLLGEGVEVDEQKAIQYFRRGASFQDGKCMQALAMCYRNGDGVEKDPAKTVYWLKNGAKIGHAGCQYHLALCYESGEGIETDYNEAVTLMKKSAAHSPEARKWLKAHHEKGPGFWARLRGGRQ